MNQLKDIISKSVKGHAKSQRALYEQYRTAWYMTALRYGKNKSEAEDMFQEGLINIFKNLHQYDHTKAAFSTWSTRVLINASLTYLKKNSWASMMMDIDERPDVADDKEDAYSQIAAKELTHMIQLLPIGYRLVFNMYVIEGFSHKEIAAALNINEGTSKSQLSKAKRKLKTQLEKQLSINSY